MLTALHIFGRAPIPGETKSRLIPLLGVAGAAMAQARLLAYSVATGRLWQARSSQRLVRLWTTVLEHPFGHTLLPRADLRQQCVGDLGARLLHAARVGLQEADAILLMGGDAVSVDRGVLDAAEAGLHEVDAVLVPAEDGGYLLFGMKRVVPELFAGVTWGGATVFAETEERLRELGWSWSVLKTRWDVDGPNDWQRFERY